MHLIHRDIDQDIAVFRVNPNQAVSSIQGHIEISQLATNPFQRESHSEIDNRVIFSIGYHSQSDNDEYIRAGEKIVEAMPLEQQIITVKKWNEV